MDESTIENIRYKFELKKLIGDETILTDVNKTDIRSDPWIDDLDMLTSTPNSDPLEDKTDKDISYSVLYGNNNEEAKLIEEDVDLYNDLLKIEEEEKKAKQMHEMEFENCKKELRKFQELDRKNNTKIEELTKENTNLKKSISSLYRTFKREIEFKDNELSEANNEITRLTKLTYRTNGQMLKNGKCSFCENISNDSKKDYNTSKRKRSKSPEQLSNKKEHKSSIPKTYEKDLQFEKDQRTHGRSEHRITDNKQSSHMENNADKKDILNKQISKFSQHDKETQTSNQCIFCVSRQNSSEMLFNLLPDSLKKSIHNYEQDQVSALKKLKESLINEYFNSGSNVPPSVSESVPKRQNIPIEELVSNKNSDILSSPGNMPISVVSPQLTRETELAKSTKKYEAKNDCAQSNVSKVSNNDDSRSNKKEESISNKHSEKKPLSRLDSTPTTSFEHCKRTESARNYENNETDKNEIKKDTAQKDFSNVPKNCYTSRQIEREELISNKCSENISSSSRNEAIPSSSSEHSKITESDRRFKRDVLDKYKSKRDRPQRRDSKISKNYSARQTKKDVISLFNYRKQKIPFDVKKRFELHKDDQKMIPKHLL